MPPTLVINSKALAYSDPAPSSSPVKKHFDWTQSLTTTLSKQPRSDGDVILAGASQSFFNGQRSTSIDGTSAFTVTKNSISENRYRFTSVAGTAPVFRTDRLLTLSGQNLTVAVLDDETVTMTLGGGSWGAVVAGDTVFLPGPVTGDGASPFSVSNQGFWTVLAGLSSTVIQCTRPVGDSFEATGELVAVAANAQVQAFSAAGVQEDDKVEISAAFAAATQKTFVIDRVTPGWFEVLSTTAIPLEAGKLPTAAGMLFYTNAKVFLRVEANQEVSLRLNGATDDRVRVSPVEAGVDGREGWFEKWGPTWSLTVVNKSSLPVTVTIFSAE